MNKFIKLTATVNDEGIYLNVENIVGFYKVKEGTHVIIKLYVAKKIQRDLGYLVKESPEEIMSIIERN